MSTTGIPQGFGSGLGPGLGKASAAEAEKDANTTVQKPRSCVVCRRRKVRCDKTSPCSNCRRANIPCLVPSSTADRPPRWARRLELADNDDDKPAIERLAALEALVRDLKAQLAQHKDVDRLPVSDANASTPSRYVSSGFWSTINDELDALKIGPGGDDHVDDDNDDASEDADSPENNHPPDRHAFLFRHNLRPGLPLHHVHPLPSQLPYILDVFAENVNYFLQIVHMPTLRNQVRALRGGGGDLSTLPICTQALLLSISYAAVTSLEDHDVLVNFGTSKADLGQKYRLGLEHALARADFLDNPDLALVQAFAIFLALVRRHDSPRYVWMLTGLAIRMAQALGLHRDGSHSPHLTPFEVEMRRRVWHAVCSLDLRASEDQGTDVTIARSSYDTRLPRSINDADLDVDTRETPPERPGISDSTIAILMYKINDASRRMVAPGATIDEQDALLQDMAQIFDRGYLQHTTTMSEPPVGRNNNNNHSMAAWVGTTVLRLVVAKMTLLVYLPVLLAAAPGGDRVPDDDTTRNRLLVAAIEVAEYHHALNAEEGCRQWRWVYQTYTHWYAIVYLLIEVLRRPLSPVAERAWLALHSRWLIPTTTTKNHKLRSSSHVWVPLRKMMTRARQHREAELDRLRGDPHAVNELEEAGRDVPVPGSPGPSTTTTCLEHWRRLVAAAPRHPQEPGNFTLEPSLELSSDLTLPIVPPIVATIPNSTYQPEQQIQLNNNNHASSTHPDYSDAAWPSTSSTTPGPATIPLPPSTLLPGLSTTTAPEPSGLLGSWLPQNGLEQTSNNNPWDQDQGLPPWLLWADSAEQQQSIVGYKNNDYPAPDVNMEDVDTIDWVAWVESAKNLESASG